MGPTSERSAALTAPTLPASADFNAILNNISLASAKHNKILSSLRAKHPSAARPPAPLETSTSVAITEGAFSSLTKPKISPTPSTTISSNRARGTGDDSDLRFENPSTGIGYTASKSDAKDSAVTRDLSRRLLGKRGREVHNGVATQKRRIQEEESEEEEGRSGLGRKKKKRARAEQEDCDEAEVEASYPAAVQHDEGGDGHINIPGSNPDAFPASGKETQNDAAGEDTTTPPETVTVKSEAKRKKNQKNRKKKKANEGVEV